MVSEPCRDLDISHRTLLADWSKPPEANVQAEARAMRYRLLNEWAVACGLDAIATAHHADDQAETLLMRLLRGAGVAGLGGTRAKRALSEDVKLIRPLLGWRKAELEELVADAELTPVDDPSNRDPRHDRSRIRQMLSEADWADPAGSRPALCARDADEALDWALAPHQLAHQAGRWCADHRAVRPAARIEAKVAGGLYWACRHAGRTRSGRWTRWRLAKSRPPA
jgi:tRNA(Ile)-lysidine synthase